MMTSCLGPQAFFHKPMISIGTASGSVPVKTVQAVPVMPGLSSAGFLVWTGPVLGGLRGGLAAKAGANVAANAKDTGAIRARLVKSGTPIINLTTLTP